MIRDFPDPGEGYAIREYLGGGHWKSAYRASTPLRLADVAVLFFHDSVDYETIAKDVSSLIRAAPNDPNSKYIAQFYSLNIAPDHRIFIVEELLARPLDRIAPLHDLTQFVRIARDLSRGLLFLHNHNLVHRDLKLDNCGLDHQQQAKIFDLGSVTSDPGEVLGTIFTRAPELFHGGTKCDNITDVWALGATLMALRTGECPFVHQHEVEERRLINFELREGKISGDDAQRRKRKIDKAVHDRITRQGAEATVVEKVHATLRGRSKDILLSMLSFDRSIRRPIHEIEADWSALAREFAGTAAPVAFRRGKWDQIKVHLKAVEQKETKLTTKQLDKIISDYEHEGPEDEELATHIRRAKERLAMAK